MQRSPLPLVEHIIPHLSQAHYIRASGKGLFRSVASAKERPGRQLLYTRAKTFRLRAGEFRAKSPRPGEAFRVELLSLPVGGGFAPPPLACWEPVHARTSLSWAVTFCLSETTRGGRFKESPISLHKNVVFDPKGYGMTQQQRENAIERGLVFRC